jgi:hypothetical protein
MRNLVFALLGCALLCACGQPKPEAEESAAPATPQPIEIGDAKYIDVSKKALKAICEGNIDAFVADLADNAKFNWNYLDSLEGKQAITDYWKERRGNVIDTLITSNEVWLVLKANEPVAPTLPTGTWVFAWYKATATYKATGKSMTQWIHQTQHFDANGKVDYTYQFLDRVPIMAALKK